MVKRSISKEKYLLAGLFTFLIFVLGLSLGLILDNYRVKWVEYVNKQQELDYASLQFQYLLLSSLEDENASCSVLKATMDTTIAELGESLDSFLEYQKQSKLNKEDYSFFERRYTLDNLRYWLFAKKARKMCNIDVVTILYFYSEDECDICPNQGVILTYFKKIFEERILIFPINIDVEENEPAVELIRKSFNVASYPALVIEGNTFQGEVVEKKELWSLICPAFANPQPECG